MRSHANRYALIALAIAFAAAGSACGHAPADPPGNPTAAPTPRQAVTSPPLGGGQTRVPGEYIVTLAPGADTKVIADVFRRFGIKSIKEVMGSVFLVTVSEDPGPERMEALRKQDARIKAIQPNFVYGPGASAL